jgi:chromosomal replication initiation ATPase DnaA
MEKTQTKEKQLKRISNLKKLDQKISIEKNKVMKLQNLMINVIIDEVCNVYNVSFDKLIQKDRHSNYVLPRQIIMYKLRDIGLSLTKIGSILHRDHTTIMHGIKVIESQKDFYDDIKLN